MSQEDDYQASFIGPCTCQPSCPAYDQPDAHGWGECGQDGCDCEAGWWE